MARRNQKIGRGLVAGLAGGFIASWTMNQFQEVWAKATELTQEKPSPHQQRSSKRKGKSQAESEDATMKAADKLSRGLLRRPLSKQEKKKAGPLVHYAFGSAMGAFYGVTAELFPGVTFGFGTVFGATLFAIADEVAVPVLGLSGKPTESPLSSHVYGLASHLVYGTTTEAIRRAGRAAM